MVFLAGGVMCRFAEVAVMLSEPGLSAAGGGALAFEQFVAPSRVLFGQISDRHSFCGPFATIDPLQ